MVKTDKLSMKWYMLIFTIFFHLNLAYGFDSFSVFEAKGKYTFVDVLDKEYQLRSGKAYSGNGVLFGQGKSLGVSLGNFQTLSLSGNSFIEIENNEILLKIGALKVNSLEGKEIKVKTKVGLLRIESGIVYADCSSMECLITVLHGDIYLDQTKLKGSRTYIFDFNDANKIKLSQITILEKNSPYYKTSFFDFLNTAKYENAFDFALSEFRTSDKRELFKERRAPASIAGEDNKEEKGKVVVHELVLDSLRVGIEEEIVKMISKKAYEVAKEKTPAIIAEIIPEFLIKRTYTIGKKLMLEEVDQAVKSALEDYSRGGDDIFDSNANSFAAQEIAFVRTKGKVLSVGQKELIKVSENIISQDAGAYLIPEVYEEVKNYSYSFGVKKGADILANVLVTTGMKYRPEMKIAVLELSKRYSNLHSRRESIKQSERYLSEIAGSVSRELVGTSLKKFAKYFGKKAKILARAKSRNEFEKLNKRSIASEVTGDFRREEVRYKRSSQGLLLDASVGKPQF
tara:strand:+ start:7461 stop:8999 length:1539 start_codon:yes stop_codon:yes gene_type:complete